MTTDSMTPLERERDPSHKEVGRSFVLLSQKKHTKKHAHNTHEEKNTKKNRLQFCLQFFDQKKVLLSE